MKEITPNTVLDTTGLICPEPLMLVRKTVRTLLEKQILLVIADDPSTLRDIPNYCTFLNHKLLLQQTKNHIFYFYVQKNNTL